jgi:hypothetical protein
LKEIKWNGLVDEAVRGHTNRTFERNNKSRSLMGDAVRDLHGEPIQTVPNFRGLISLGFVGEYGCAEDRDLYYNAGDDKTSTVYAGTPAGVFKITEEGN